MDKKLKNELFRVAVDYLFKENKVGSQKELAEKIGITEQSLSRVMNDGRIVSDETLRKMNDAFGGIFNMAYFRGKDPHCMLMEDLHYYQLHPEERLVFKKEPVVNTQDVQPSSVGNDSAFMMSKMWESMLNHIQDAHAQTVSEKDARIADMKVQIAEKDARIKQQDETIANLHKIIADLRTMPTASNIEDVIKKYPFEVGVADNPESARTQV